MSAAAWRSTAHSGRRTSWVGWGWVGGWGVGVGEVVHATTRREDAKMPCWMSSFITMPARGLCLGAWLPALLGVALFGVLPHPEVAKHMAFEENGLLVGQSRRDTVSHTSAPTRHPSPCPSARVQGAPRRCGLRTAPTHILLPSRQPRCLFAAVGGGSAAPSTTNRCSLPQQQHPLSPHLPRPAAREAVLMQLLGSLHLDVHVQYGDGNTTHALYAVLAAPRTEGSECLVLAAPLASAPSSAIALALASLHQGEIEGRGIYCSGREWGGGQAARLDHIFPTPVQPPSLSPQQKRTSWRGPLCCSSRWATRMTPPAPG